MPLRNTPTRYGWPAKLFHWSMALIILGLIALGLYLDGAEISPNKLQLIWLHKSFGILILMLVVLRYVWRGMNVVPKLPDDMPKWQKMAADLSHYGLYALMFTVPLVGWLMSSAYGFAPPFFGVTMPNLIEVDKDLGKWLREWHGLLAYTLLAVIVVHLSAALFHHFVQKDNVLKRMIPFGKD